jgi:hypothetical protein
LIAGSGEVIKLFKTIQHYLPPFRMTLSPHDVPTRLTDYNVKAAMLEAAEEQICEYSYIPYQKFTSQWQILQGLSCRKSLR